MRISDWSSDVCSSDLDGTLWFASEPKALFAAVPGRAQLSVRGLLQAFSYWAPLDPDTAWEGVHSLPPGHVLAIEADGRETLARYWDWTFPDAADTADAVREHRTGGRRAARAAGRSEEHTSELQS